MREIFDFPGVRFRLWIAALKIILTSLALTGLALANPAGPGESAIGFLEQVRSGTLNLEPGGDTALAPSTGERKREEISRRLQRLADDLGKESLAIGSVRQEDDLAAVLVRTTGGFDPGRLQVFPVALIRRGAAWLAAPLPASFENSGIAYNPPTPPPDRLARILDAARTCHPSGKTPRSIRERTPGKDQCRHPC